MYEDMKKYVKDFLYTKGSLNCTELDKEFPFRDRYEHTIRVLKWAERINEVEGGDREVVEIAAIFHDVGKNAKDKPHAKASADICRHYLNSINFDKERAERIVRAVSLHSSKELPAEELLIEDRIIMDADILDELGAMSVLWDCLDMGAGTEQSYIGAYNRILMHYNRRREAAGYAKTKEGRRLYIERVDLLGEFLKGLKYELGI